MVKEIAALNRGKKKKIQEITFKNYMFSKVQMFSSTLPVHTLLAKFPFYIFPNVDKYSNTYEVVPAL